MNIYVAQHVRNTTVKGFSNLSTSMKTSGIREGMKIYATIGQLEGSVLAEDLIPEEGVKINEVKTARVDCLTTMADSYNGQTITVRSGGHRAVATMLNGVDITPYLVIVEEDTARVLEVRDNLDHDATVKMDGIAKRKNAIRLYLDGEFQKESELSKWGFNRIQRIMGHKTAVLVVDKNVPMELTLQLNQSNLSEAYKVAEDKGKTACLDFVQKVIDGMEEKAKMLTKKELQKVQEKCNTEEHKEILQAIIEGNLENLKALLYIVG